MDNLSQQADEIEALKSIYDSQLVIESNGSYRMDVSPNAKLFITFNSNYPSDSPPDYELLAPELSFEEKKTVKKAFELIFEENLGGPILFQWIEKLKEIILNGSKKSNKTKRKSESDKHELNTPNNPKKENNLDMEEMAKQVVHGPTIEDRKSVFQGHCCPVNTETDVRLFLEYLKQNKKIAQAFHNMYAYRIRNNTNTNLLQDCDDDGEKAAGGRMLHLLEVLKVENVMVVVSRWYGGIQLGPDRFKHITNCTRQVLVEAGFIK